MADTDEVHAKIVRSEHSPSTLELMIRFYDYLDGSTVNWRVLGIPQYPMWQRISRTAWLLRVSSR